jgi:excisionase family DNA binding protein
VARDTGLEPVAFGSGGRGSHPEPSRTQSQLPVIAASGPLSILQQAHPDATTSPILADTLADAAWHTLDRSLLEPYLTVPGVANRLGVSTATVYALCRRGELGHYRISHAIRVPESAISKYLASASEASSYRFRPKTTERS